MAYLGLVPNELLQRGYESLVLINNCRLSLLNTDWRREAIPLLSS